jgi:hypothetical protein
VFREEYLLPALRSSRVILDLDGVDGLPSSFWEEALGGLVRRGMQLSEITKNLEIVTTEDELKTFVRSGWRFIREASEKSTSV